MAKKKHRYMIVIMLIVVLGIVAISVALGGVFQPSNQKTSYGGVKQADLSDSPQQFFGRSIRARNYPPLYAENYVALTSDNLRDTFVKGGVGNLRNSNPSGMLADAGQVGLSNRLTGAGHNLKSSPSAPGYTATSNTIAGYPSGSRTGADSSSSSGGSSSSTKKSGLTASSSSGTMIIDGTYVQSGSVIDLNIDNRGTYVVSGASTVNGSVTNQVGANTQIENSTASNPTVFNGVVENSGTFKTTNAVVKYNSTFTNRSAYISDPSTQIFQNLIVESDGYLKGGTEDKWVISQDFTVHSTQNSLWDTVQSQLEFSTGNLDTTSHNFYLAGVDLGKNQSGYSNNFAWGSIVLDAQNTLYILGGIDPSRGALYVKELSGISFDAKTGLTSNVIAGAGFNIYYDSSLPANSYLGGRNLTLSGGGHVYAMTSSPVPIPASGLLFGSGLVGLFAFGWRRTPRLKKSSELIEL